MDEASLIRDMNQLLNHTMEGMKIIKFVHADCPWNKKLKTIDMKLDVIGTMEDQFYSRAPELTLNVRRGNTILEM